MPKEIKRVPKKLRGGPTIGVDTQILLWRERIKKQGIILGKGALIDKQRAIHAREVRKTDSEEKILKKKFF